MSKIAIMIYDTILWYVNLNILDNQDILGGFFIGFGVGGLSVIVYELLTNKES